MEFIMFKRFELHNHTNESDAPISCAELVAMMAEEGVDCFAITDHNTVSGHYVLRDLMKHYPTVRILNTATNFEESDFRVKHDSVNALTITLGGSMGAGTYKYILD